MDHSRDLSESARNPVFRVSWSRVRLIAFVLALPSQATALQEGFPPVIASQVQVQRWVNVEAVNLRSGPGVSHSVIQVLTANNRVRVLGRSGRWAQVEWVSGKDAAIQGWIFGKFLSDNSLTQKELENLTSANSVAINRGADGSGGGTAGLFLILIVVVALWVVRVVNRNRKRMDLGSSPTRHKAEREAWQAQEAEWDETGRRLPIEVRELGQVVAKRVQTCFLVEACSRCHEFQNRLLQVSPNARSVQLQCTTCGRKYWASATNPQGYKLGEEYRAFLEKEQELGEHFGEKIVEVEIVFDVPSGSMPFEQTTREQIPTALRSEIWRRDGGQCSKCGSRERLQFDHIIPVSKGGNTTAQNLQLLCQSCNLSKGNRI